MELNNEKFVIYIEHMLHHNEHHSEDMAEAIEHAKNLGKAEAAALLDEAKALQDRANAKLRQVVDQVKTEA